MEPQGYRSRDILGGRPCCEDSYRPLPKPVTVQAGDILYGQCVRVDHLEASQA
jgi:hypothetical protein